MCVCFVTGPTPKTGNNCTSLYFIISFIISCLSRAWTFWFHFQEFKTTYWIDPRRTEVRGDGLRLPAQRERPTANKAVEVHRLLGGRLWERGTDGLLRNGGWRRSGILKNGQFSRSNDTTIRSANLHKYGCSWTALTQAKHELDNCRISVFLV